jgi:hypothetical protein
MRIPFVLALCVCAAAPICAKELPASPRKFVEAHCVECHDADTAKGGLDLTALQLDLTNTVNFAEWVLVYERITKGEMPPKKKARPNLTEQKKFLEFVSDTLTFSERQRFATEGRSTERRLNRYEYENALRDLLKAPWLQVRDSLPEDGGLAGFNKVGDALDVSHVQIARYLSAADYALRQVLAPYSEPPAQKVQRYYTRDQGSYTGPMEFTVFNTAPERATFPVLGFEAQPEVRRFKAPMTSTNAEMRELEGVGVVASAYEPIEPEFDKFRVPVAGRYKLRFNAYSVWVGPGESNKWYIPNLDDISRGRRDEPITITANTPPGRLRTLGTFDITPEPDVHEIEAWLLAGEIIRPDPGRFFRSRPGAGRWQNPLAEKDGQPGVVFRWMEVEGPIYDEWPPAGHKVLFGDLPIVQKTTAAPSPESTKPRRRRARFQPPAPTEIVSQQPLIDAESLLRSFLQRAYRHPLGATEVPQFLGVARQALDQGESFTEAMLLAYTAVLCSPEFLYLQERPGRLDDYALASRLSFFLWNSTPDEELLGLAAKHQLHRPKILHAQTDRLLAHPKSRQFVEAFPGLLARPAQAVRDCARCRIIFRLLPGRLADAIDTRGATRVLH